MEKITIKWFSEYTKNSWKSTIKRSRTIWKNGQRTGIGSSQKGTWLYQAHEDMPNVYGNHRQEKLQQKWERCTSRLSRWRRLRSWIMPHVAEAMRHRNHGRASPGVRESNSAVLREAGHTCTLESSPLLSNARDTSSWDPGTKMVSTVLLILGKMWSLLGLDQQRTGSGQ